MSGSDLLKSKLSMQTEFLHHGDPMFCNRLTLKFRARALEQEFQEQIVDRLHYDSIAHMLGFLGGIANLMEIWGKVPFAVMVLQCFATFIFSPANVYACYSNRQQYAKWRTQSVLCLWVISFILMYYNEVYHHATSMQSVQPNGITMWGLMRTSPVAFINAAALNLPLSFPVHLCANSLAMVGLGLWVLGFCHSTNMSVGLGAGMGLCSEGDCAARVTVGLFALAFVVPSTILYCSELNARGNFLQKKVRKNEKKLVSWLTWELLMSAVATGSSVLLKAWLWSVGES